MSLEEQLEKFGCSESFVKICMKYADKYSEDADLEDFIEYVEDTHALVEDAKFAEHEKKVLANAQEMMGFDEEEDSELNEDY